MAGKLFYWQMVYSWQWFYWSPFRDPFQSIPKLTGGSQSTLWGHCLRLQISCFSAFHTHIQASGTGRELIRSPIIHVSMCATETCNLNICSRRLHHPFVLKGCLIWEFDYCIVDHRKKKKKKKEKRLDSVLVFMILCKSKPSGTWRIKIITFKSPDHCH